MALSLKAHDPLTEPVPIEVLALNRMAYGPTQDELRRLRLVGLASYLEEQLSPAEEKDVPCAIKLQNARLRMEYPEGAVDGKKYKGVAEDRPLSLLNKPLKDLWPLTDYTKHPVYQERVRPFEEVQVASIIRAVHSRWQLREVMVEFWHNHFNVNPHVDERIMVTWPLYDRNVLRRHCFGNFRAFLEDVAKSPAMLYYLDNATSRSGPANENYARELFELHTLGAEHYLNAYYNRWRDVPGATQGRPVGYIDQDVYEAARAFTGWTVADGTDTGRGTVLPNTGEFHYFEGWHDHYQKRVLGVEIEPNQPPMADGLKVLDLVAEHPATAKYLCTKLCQRFVSDNPPAALVERTAAQWLMSRSSPTQIAEVLRVLFLSPEFAQSWGQKAKKPLELTVSFLRALDAEAKPNAGLVWNLAVLGYRLMHWPTPDGHPDRGGAWLSAPMMLRRWNFMLSLVMEGWMDAAKLSLEELLPESVAIERQVVDFWLWRLLTRAPARSTRQALLRWFCAHTNPDAAVDRTDPNFPMRLRQLVALIGSTPDFQLK